MKAVMSKEIVGAGQAVECRVAPVLGMDAETRQALELIEREAAAGLVAVPGVFMPDAGVRARLRRLGLLLLQFDPGHYFSLSGQDAGHYCAGIVGPGSSGEFVGTHD